jgi:uncharacterized protein (DUF305 family)
MMRIFLPALLIVMLVPCLIGNAQAQSADEPRYLEQTGRAMDRMMADMNVRPTGDIDADFVGAMVPHHRGAIDMARAELQYGRNELLRRIAQGIIVTQLQEIEAMRLALSAGNAVSVGPEGPTMPQERPHGP